jgi:hypothetical protein
VLADGTVFDPEVDPRNREFKTTVEDLRKGETWKEWVALLAKGDQEDIYNDAYRRSWFEERLSKLKKDDEQRKEQAYKQWMELKVTNIYVLILSNA